MSKKTRATQTPFGTSAGSNTFTEFGGLASSYPSVPTQYTGSTITPALVQGLSAFVNGWTSAVVAGNAPSVQDMNALFFLTFYQLGYILQQGVAEYDPSTTYFVGSVVSANIYRISISSASVTSGAIYTDGTNNFIAYSSIVSALTLMLVGPAAPPGSGTLTKVSGTGASTLTISAQVFLGSQTYTSRIDSNTGNSPGLNTAWIRTGGVNYVNSQSADYTVASIDNLIRATGTHQITFDDATAMPGRLITIKKVDSGTTTTLAFQPGQTADGASTLTLSEQYGFYTLQSNGTNWDIVAWG